MSRPADASPAAPPALRFRSALRPGDVAAVRELVRGTGLFSAEEEAIAAELVEAGLREPDGGGYRFLLADEADPADPAGLRLAGYTCFGAIPATDGSFDLYWIAVRTDLQRRGVGRALLARTEARAAELGARRLYVDTAGRAAYAPTRAFYERAGYARAATLPDFYAEGDPRVIYVRALPVAAPR